MLTAMEEDAMVTGFFETMESSDSKAFIEQLNKVIDQVYGVEETIVDKA